MADNLASKGLHVYGSQSMELMTKREYFAAQAMAAALSTGQTPKDAAVLGCIASDELLRALSKQDPRS